MKRKLRILIALLISNKEIRPFCFIRCCCFMLTSSVVAIEYLNAEQKDTESTRKAAKKFVYLTKNQ